MDKTYLIDDAAKFIGISRRNFERMNISSREEFREAKDGKKRKVRVYDETELERVKVERENSLAKPSIVRVTNDNTPDPVSQVVTLSDFKLFAEMLMEGINERTQKLLISATEEKHKRFSDISSFKDKQILNFAQALAYSGLPEGELKKALKDKTILGKKTSEKGTWKIYKNSLDDFIKDYFS
jgi:hypothetical protein